MLVPDRFFYTLANPEFYEPLDRFTPDPSDYLGIMRRLLPPAWEVSRRSIWFLCHPAGSALPPQGWKIHLSATLANAPLILTSAARVLVKCSVPFKFALDKRILFLLNSKRWSRGGAGKFMTIYPQNDAQFVDLIKALHQALIGYQGPYILSDRRYKDSGVIHYRYGGILPTRRLNIRGEKVPVLQTHTGKTVDDQRAPYFLTPEGVTDPFTTDTAIPEQQAQNALKNGRYVVESAITFSNTGGVYVAVDTQTGQKVLVKEARPFTNVSPRGTDAVWLLKKEHRLLTLLEDAAVAPRAIDFFKDWEHYFLVEEFLDGRILRGYTSQHALGLLTRPSLEDVREFYGRYCRLYARIAEILKLFHERRIVFSDMSHYNIMVLNDGEDIRFIDFEGAYEQGVDLPTILYTPGFAPTEMVAEGVALPEDDCYGLGGLMLAGLIPMNNLLLLEPQGYDRFLEAWKHDLSLPEDIAQTMRGLLQQDRSKRHGLANVIETLKKDFTFEPPTTDTPEVTPESLASLLQRCVDYIATAATFDRDDRVYPCDPEVFETNPLSVGFGACGVAYALHRVTGRVPQPLLDWILRQHCDAESYPPGLYVGLSGIAWSLLELGLRDQAVRIARIAQEHPLLNESPDFFYGVAGWGMTQVKFFLETGDDQYLTRAVEAGEFLVHCRKEEDGRCWWPSLGDTCAGLAHGASGVSLFLLYLYLSTGNEHFLEIGSRGLEFVLSVALRNPDGGLTWRAKEGEPTYTPYWRWGSAGVGMVLLRYQKVFGDGRYQDALNDILLDADRKYTIFPGRFFGLAGIGEFLLDLAHFGSYPARALESARRVMSGILLFRVEREQGIAFPGETLMRISCDFGTGSAGIGLFVHRLLTGAGPAFMLDELLEQDRTLSRPGLSTAFPIASAIATPHG